MTEQFSPVGPWARIEELGRGGNATVWRAARDGGPEVALKVINETKVQSESYQRFIREVDFFRRNESIPGVLPMLDSYLPEHPSKNDRAWLSMPIATPIDRALDGRPLADVVEAVATIAETLARLQRDHAAGHRDIKPGNLYERAGEWLIGDFGLISVPDAASLTEDGRQVGPVHFTAYEMILNPSDADPYMADVFSLGKTLWVLATGQRYAPSGHQAVGNGMGIGELTPHTRSLALDREIDLMTQDRPEDRPPMEQVARDLRAWIALDSTAPALDVSAAKAALRAKLRTSLAARDTEALHKDLAFAAVRRMQDLVRPLNDELKSLDSRTQIDLTNDELTKNQLAAPLQFRHTTLWSWNRCTRVAPVDGPMAPTLRMSRALHLLDDGTLILQMLVLVAPDRLSGQHFFWAPSELATAPVGTIEAERMLDNGVRELAAAVDAGVAALVEAIPDQPGGA